MKRKEVHEVFEEAQNSKDPAAILAANPTDGVRQMCQLIFDDNITLNLPDTPPPYVMLDKDYFAESYHRKVPSMSMFVGESRLSQSRRELRFVSLLEVIHPKDAQLLIAACTKTNEEVEEYHIKALYPKITKTQVKKAFPGLIK